VILWCDGAHGPRENMRRDAALLDGVADGRLASPVLRLFTFDPAGITLGHSQEPGRELDLDRLAADGIEWAVRPTGGRAIFHEQEWTFSFALPLGESGGAAAAPEAYARTCGLLASALRALGVPVEFSPGSPRGVGAPRVAGGPASPCFASAARNELTLAGRKFAGIAQRRLRGALLQQGSLLLGEAHLRLVDYLRLEPRAREGARAALAGATAHAGAVLGAAAPLERLASAIEAVARPREHLRGEAGAAALGI
jgi:lipoyl(octanoyl) transferase